MRMGSARQVVAASLVLSSAILGAIGTTSTAGAAPLASAAPAQQCNTNTAVAPVLSTDALTLDASATTTVNVTGTNYLVPPHVCGTEVFGGVYLFFGWVQPGGQWGPSHKNETSMTGTFGNTYSYPGEGGGGDTRDDGTGVVRLVSFTNGGESGSATAFHMDGNGNWQANLVVRGATYTFKDIVSGTTATVDCRQVQCGVFTIGAHGKASPINEQFVPINFTQGGQVVVPPANGGNAGAGGVVANGGVNSSGGVVGGNGTGGSGSTGSGSGSGSGSGGSDSTGGSSGSGSGATTTTVAGATGDVSTLGDPAAAGAAESTTTTEAKVLDSETAAAEVQTFDSGDSGGGSSGILIAGGVILVLALVAGGVILMRRRSVASNGAAS